MKADRSSESRFPTMLFNHPAFLNPFLQDTQYKPSMQVDILIVSQANFGPVLDWDLVLYLQSVPFGVRVRMIELAIVVPLIWKSLSHPKLLQHKCYRYPDTTACLLVPISSKGELSATATLQKRRESMIKSSSGALPKKFTLMWRH